MSDAADRILQRYATLYGDSGPAQTRDAYIVARRVKELEAKLEEQQRVCRVITRIRQKAQARLDRMRKAFKRTGKQLLAKAVERECARCGLRISHDLTGSDDMEITGTVTTGGTTDELIEITRKHAEEGRL